MNDEIYQRLLPYYLQMKQIIINSSASNLSIDFKTTMDEVGKQLGISRSCGCSSGWFIFVNKIYDKYLEYVSEQQSKIIKIIPEDNEKTTKSKRNSKNN